MSKRLTIILAATALTVGSACGGGNRTARTASATNSATRAVSVTTGVVDAGAAGTASTSVAGSHASGKPASSAGAAGPSTVPSSSARPSPAGQGSSAPLPASAAPSLTPMAPGTYRYATSGTDRVSGPVSSSHPLPDTTTATVIDQGDGTLLLRRDLRLDNGDGQLVEYVLRPTAGNYELVRVHIVTHELGNTDDRSLQVNERAVYFPADRAATPSSTFTLSGSGVNASAHLSFVDNGGVTAVTAGFSFSGELSGSLSTNASFRDVDGFTLSEEVHGDVSFSGVRYQVDYKATLES